ncbi:sulfatase-like hydrolase/transferase [Alienimonas chondri]|uniref:Arylsulfatase n=1 Tax=Alienimonas chondri TaxID=2681879 RepID=A0ABX1V9R4_9PLAN|nr:sulfatase-like hydrolase/transferase [Alienimonas chondri]NNJ24735.1 Arylsulfatase [Alienimonas chondri]
MNPRQLFAVVLLCAHVGVAAAGEQPNVIVIYTDDQGYGDVAALNPEAKFSTPNLDRLANEGIVFTRGHSADSVCTPSRYGLLTGRYAWRTTLKRHVMGAEGEGLIADDRMTFASLLKEQGYRTAMVGKWHLGMDFPGTPDDRDWSQPTLDMPLDKGFDYYYGVPASLNYGVLAWFEGRHAAVPPTLYTSKKPNARHMDYRIKPPYSATRKEEGRGKGVLEVAPDFIDNQCLTRFTDKAIAWIDEHASGPEGVTPFFLYLPYTSPHYPVCPLPEFHGRGDAGAYGEFVIETDHHVGRVLAFLKDRGLDDNTLIVFTSDNGPENSWKSRIKQFDHDSRGGLREGKRSVYEGGHRVPFLVRWPAGITEPGRRWDGPVGQVDLLATLADLIGASLPPEAGEDSHSFASVLRDADANHDRIPLVVHGNDGRYGIIDGDWKLILPRKPGDAELYDVAADPTETRNLASERPEIVERMIRDMTRIVTEGRSNPGPPQPNDTGYWKDLTWIAPGDYRAATESLGVEVSEESTAD